MNHLKWLLRLWWSELKGLFKLPHSRTHWWLVNGFINNINFCMNSTPSIVNIDDSLMLHQCSFMFSLFFHIEASDVPYSKHQGIINETSMNLINETTTNHRWEKSYVYVFFGWFQRNTTTSSSTRITSIKLIKNNSQKFELKGERAIIQALSEKKTLVLSVYRGTPWVIFLK